jgi:hypothetical protein
MPYLKINSNGLIKYRTIKFLFKNARENLCHLRLGKVLNLTQKLIHRRKFDKLDF